MLCSLFCPFFTMYPLFLERSVIAKTALELWASEKYWFKKNVSLFLGQEDPVREGARRSIHEQEQQQIYLSIYIFIYLSVYPSI